MAKLLIFKVPTDGAFVGMRDTFEAGDTIYIAPLGGLTKEKNGPAVGIVEAGSAYEIGGVAQTESAIYASAKGGIINTPNGPAIDALSKKKLPARPKNTGEGSKKVCAIGNSITAGSELSGDGIVRSSYFEHLAAALGGTYTRYVNAGIGGTDSAQGLARIADDVPDDADICFIMFAANCYTNGISQEDRTAHVRGMIQNLKDRSIRPILLMSPPNDTLARSEYIYTANIRDWVLARVMGVEIYDGWEDYVNPATGGWLAGISDGTHPDTAIAIGAAAKIAQCIRDKEYAVPKARINGMTGAIMTNELLMTDGNSDGIPDRFAANANGTKTLTETALGLGRTFELAGTNVLLSANSSAFALKPGHRYLFSMRCEVEVTSGAPLFTLRLQYNDGSVHYLAQNISTDLSARTITYEFDMPEDLTTQQLYISTTATTYQAAIRIAQVQWFDITETGIE